MRLRPFNEWSEDQLFALRTLCLIRLRDHEADEEVDRIIDTYGEGDDQIIRELQKYWEELRQMNKQQVTAQYRFFSRVEILAHNNRAP